MALRRKVIITSAVTGAIHTPSMSPHLPVTPDEIIAEGRRAAEAGAAIHPNLKQDWERAHLENSRDLVFRNTFARRIGS